MRPRDPSSHRVSSDTARRVDRLERRTSQVNRRQADPRLFSATGTGTSTVIDGSGSESWGFGDVTWVGDDVTAFDTDVYDVTVNWRLDISTARVATFACQSSGAGDWRITSGLNDFATTVAYASSSGLLYIDGTLSSTADVHGLVAADTATPTVRVLAMPKGIGSLS